MYAGIPSKTPGSKNSFSMDVRARSKKIICVIAAPVRLMFTTVKSFLKKLTLLLWMDDFTIEIRRR